MYTLYIGLKDNSEVMQLPVNPSELNMKQSGNFEKYNIVEFGEIIVLDKRKLITFNLVSFFPLYYAPYCSTENLYDPQYYADKLTEWKTNNQVLRFVVSGSKYPVNIMCVIDELEIKEKGGEVGDLYYSISLTEYREFKARMVELKRVENEVIVKKKVSNPRPQTFKTPQSYTVKTGDSLWLIAKRQFNDGSKYRDIADLNNIQNVNLIYPGQKLRLPEVQA